MSKQPFFSIVIPTRNRPQLLKFALISLLKQSFTDFEVIVSDNSFPKDVREVFEKYSDDRFKYVRPEHELPMCSNWEFALSHAQGKYVTILEDKMFYYQEGLNNYYKVIQKESYPDIINTNEDSYILTNEEQGQIEGYLQRKISGNGYKVYDPQQVIEEKIECKWGDLVVHAEDAVENIHCGGGIGSLMGGMIKNEVIDAVRKKYGKVFDSYCPDYGPMILFLNEAKSAVGLLDNQVVHIHSNTSNGKRTEMDVKLLYDFIFNSEVGVQRMEYAVVPNMLFGCENLVTADYNYALEKIGFPKRCNTLNFIYVIESNIAMIKKWPSKDWKKKHLNLLEQAKNKALNTSETNQKPEKKYFIEPKITETYSVASPEMCMDAVDLGSSEEKLLFDAMEKYDKVYCYGAGTWGRYIAKLFAQQGKAINGFIVSSKTQDRVEGTQVYSLQEYDNIGNACIIIAVSPRYQKDIIANLQAKGIDNFYLPKWLF